MTTTAQDTDVLADPATARRLLELALDHGPSLEGRTAGEIIEWGAEHLRTPLAVTMSMQDTVLAELASRHAPDAGGRPSNERASASVTGADGTVSSETCQSIPPLSRVCAPRDEL